MANPGWSQQPPSNHIGRGHSTPFETASQQAVGIDAQCHDCRHKAVLGFELFLVRYGDMPFSEFARLLKCSSCGSRKIDARPMWAKR